MTRTRTSLLLTALLVVGAMTAGLSGAVPSSSEATYQAQDDEMQTNPVDSGEVFWQGQFLRFTAGEANASEIWAVRRVQDGEVGRLVTEVLLDANGSAVISTGGLDGRFVIVNEDEQPVVFQNGQAVGVGSVSEAAFEVVDQTLTASFATGTVTNADSPDARTDLRIRSNRAGYQAYLFSDQLSASQLASVFSDVAVRNGRAFIIRDISSDAVFDANFTGIEPGTYNITVAVADGAAEATATITVSEPVEGSAALSNDTIIEQRGDVVRFNVTLNGTDRATVALGSREVGLLSRFTVVDANGDGVVTVAADTYRLGLSPSTPGVSAVGEDRVTDYQLVTDPLPGRLDAATYPISVSIGGRETAVGVLDLNERSTGAIQVWTAPDRESLRSLSALSEIAVQDSDIAFQDWVVVQVGASGLYSYVQNVSDLNNNTTGLSMSVTRLGGMNIPPEEVALDQARLLVDEENNQLFLVMDSNVLERGSEYRANFTITPANPYVSAATTLTTNFTIVERTASFDQPVQVPSASGATISGRSSVAPGTELTITAKNTADNPFLKRQTATVNEDGTWEATFDFSDVPPNTNFTVSIEEPQANATGVVVSEGGGAAQQTTNETNQTTTAVEETTPAEETTTAVEETTPAEETTTAVEETTTTTEETTTVADEETTETPAGGTTTTAETTTVEEAGTAPAPGFGPIVAVVGVALLLAGGVLALRRR